jgi:hypothetical protein
LLPTLALAEEHNADLLRRDKFDQLR